MNRFDQAILKNGLITGFWLNESSMPQAAILARLGAGFVCIDLEHSAIGGISHEQVLAMTYAIRANSPTTAVLIRVPAPDPRLVSQLCQLGPDGLVIPQVDNPEQARAVWKATMFPPEGTCGVSGQQPRNAFGVDDWTMPTVIPQLESVTAEAALPALMAVQEIGW